MYRDRNNMLAVIYLKRINYGCTMGNGNVGLFAFGETREMDDGTKYLDRGC